jgi:hypothetical protein
MLSNPIFRALNVPPLGSIPSSGLQLWFKADTFAVSDGTSVSSWADQSGNANDGTVSSGTATFHTAQINGRPAVTFSSCHLTLATGIVPSNGHSLFAVFKLSSTAAKSSLFSGAANTLTYWLANGGKLQGVDKTQALQFGVGTASQDTNWHQSNVLMSNNSGGFFLQFRLDRASDATSSSTATDVGSGNQTALGYNAANGGEAFAGQLAEFLYYNRTITSTEVTTIETYLNSRYAL